MDILSHLRLHRSAASILLQRWRLDLRRRWLLPASYPALLTNLRDGILIVDADNHILEANRVAERLLGKSAAQLMGQPIDQIAPELASLQSGPASVGGELILQLGHPPRTIEMHTSTVQDGWGRPMGRVIDLRDITLQQRSEGELIARHTAEQKFSAQLTTLAAVTNEMSKISTLDDLCRRAVEAGRDRLGFDRLALWFVTPDHTTMLGTYGTGPDGQTTDERQAQHPIAKTSHIWPIIEGRLALHHYENAPLYQVDSQQVGRGERITVGLWDGETVIGFLSVDNLLQHRSFTQHDCELLHLYASALGHLCTLKRVQEALTQLAEDLEQRVTERTAELEQANHELEAFAYSVSHDLRTPLRVIDGYTRLLAENHAASLAAEGQRLCAIVRAKTRQMDQLIDDLLAFSKAGRAEIEKSQINMTAVVTAVFQELTMPEERLQIDLQLEPLPPAQGDLALIHQVWINLLSNAIKFSARRERPVIRVTSLQSGGNTIYAVQDNGAGFSMQYAHKLFGVFQRLHSEQEFSGTGIGLAIIQRIIHRHGGRIWAEGVPDQGATFYFTLE